MSSNLPTLQRFPTARMTSYLSLSAAGLVATSGMAEVVHIPQQDLPVEMVNDNQLFLYLSLRSPGVENNYDFNLVPQTSYGGTFIVLSGNQGSVQHLVSTANESSGAGTSVGPGTTIDANLDEPDDLFWSNGYVLDPGDFDGPQHFLPVRFPVSDDYHYGFIEIEITTPERTLRILDAAWETELGVPIDTPAALDEAALSAIAGGDEAMPSLRWKD